MVASMTAFARLEEAGDWGSAAWEIRTVNHRYLDISLRLPDALRVLENTAREQIAARLTRGKVDCLLRCEVDGTADEFRVNMALARQVITAAKRLGLPGPASINPLDVLRWPGVLEGGRLAVDTLTPPITRLLHEALDTIVTIREREGSKMQGLIQQRCDSCRQHIEQIRQHVPTIISGIRDRFLTRARETGLILDEGRLEQELLLICQRMDVAEELERLQAHIDEVSSVLQQDKPIGRRLDFLMQEMHREANTLGAKSAHLTMRNASVDLKVLIEQMREQIQNVE